MKNSFSYVSLISTDDYLPGLLVLFSSLKETSTAYPFLVLVTPNVSSNTLSVLKKYEIHHKVLEHEVLNPGNINSQHRWFATYSKLHVFGQTQYDKVVYLDADMLVMRNIDELFKHPHMSATNAGGMIPRKSSWTYLNSGLFVAEPSGMLFRDMLQKVGKIEKVNTSNNLGMPKRGSDQDFLNAYYPDWSSKKELHLDHKYNTFHYHLDEYHNLFGYSIDGGPKPVSVIHYASYIKPWNLDDKIKIALQKRDATESLGLRAIRLWLARYNKISRG